MLDNVARRIQEFVQSDFVFDDSIVDLNASLVDEGLIDSTGILEVVLFLEETFEISVDDDDVVPENFDSIARLASYVRSKLGARADATAVGD